MPDTELCSIVMPCYGMGKYVGAALESIAAQTYPSWELIVVDDCGPDDGTESLVRDFEVRHPSHRIAYLRHLENQGVSGARRTGVLESRGRYLAFLDPDDLYEPDKLARHVAVLNDRPHVVLVHGGIQAIDCDAETRQKLETGFALCPTAKEYNLREDPLCFLGNWINNSTVVCRRDAVHSGDFPNKLIFQAEDWFLWLRLAERGTFFFDPHAVTRYRWHPDCFSARVFDRPGGAALAFLEVLATLYGLAEPKDKAAVMQGMIGQLHRLIVERGMTADPPVTKASAGLWRSLVRSYLSLLAQRIMPQDTRRSR